MCLCICVWLFVAIISAQTIIVSWLLQQLHLTSWFVLMNRVILQIINENKVSASEGLLVLAGLEGLNLFYFERCLYLT